MSMSDATRVRAHSMNTALLQAMDEVTQKRIAALMGVADSTDNRFVNLRDVPAGVNSQNIRRPMSTSTSGALGARFNGYGWVAELSINGRNRYIGTFATADQAHVAYVEAKRLHHEGCTL